MKHNYAPNMVDIATNELDLHKKLYLQNAEAAIYLHTLPQRGLGTFKPKNPTQHCQETNTKGLTVSNSSGGAGLLKGESGRPLQYLKQFVKQHKEYMYKNSFYNKI